MHEPISYGELTHFFCVLLFSRSKWNLILCPMIETENLLKLFIVQVFVYLIH